MSHSFPGTPTTPFDGTVQFVLRDGPLEARLLDPHCAFDALCYETLRHRYFVVEKGWVADDPTLGGRERDSYDPHCRHLGVFLEGKLVCYLRLLPWSREVGFMLETDFAKLLPKEEGKLLFDETMGEISRFVVAPSQNLASYGGSNRHGSGLRDSNHHGDNHHGVELLFKLLYRLSQRLGLHWYYAVVETKWHTAFVRRFHFPFERVGVVHTFPDSTQTCCIRAHITSIEMSLRSARGNKWEWYCD